MQAHRAAALTAAALLTFALAPGRAEAQARVLVMPSADAGLVLDDNLFVAPKGAATSDTIFRITPGLSASRESARHYWFGSYSFDAERYQEHPTMTTPLARQTATAFGRIGMSPVSTLTLSSGYESTVTPSDFNVATGLLAGYLRAWRVHGGPEIRHATGPVTFVRLGYDVTYEGLDNQRILTHAVDFRLAHALGARDELRIEPFFREFVFDTDALSAAGGTIGWTRRLTPFTSLSLQGGPRFVEGSSTARPELDLALRRRTTYSDVSLSYTRTSATAIGLRGLAETQRLAAGAGYHHPAVLDVGVEAAAYLNEIGDRTVRVYRITTEILRALTPGTAIALFYSLDMQRGLVPSTRVIANPDLALGTGGFVPGPLVVEERTAVEVPLRRNVVGIRFVVSPTFHPTRVPPKENPDSDKPSSGSIR